MSAAAQHVSNDSLSIILNVAVTKYNNKEYSAAIQLLETILSEFQDAEQTYILDTHKYLAYCKVAIGDTNAAHKQFKLLLDIAPRYELDPLTTKPEILQIFQGAQYERARESAMCSCFLPGAGQLLQGNEKKGMVIMSMAGLSLTASILSWLITDNKGNYYNSLGPEDINQLDKAYDDYDRWYKISLVSSAIFISVYLYSIFDALPAKAHRTDKNKIINRMIFKNSDRAAALGYQIKLSL